MGRWHDCLSINLKVSIKKNKLTPDLPVYFLSQRLFDSLSLNIESESTTEKERLLIKFWTNIKNLNSLNHLLTLILKFDIFLFYNVEAVLLLLALPFICALIIFFILGCRMNISFTKFYVQGEFWGLCGLLIFIEVFQFFQQPIRF